MIMKSSAEHMWLLVHALLPVASHSFKSPGERFGQSSDVLIRLQCRGDHRVTVFPNLEGDCTSELGVVTPRKPPITARVMIVDTSASNPSSRYSIG